MNRHPYVICRAYADVMIDATTDDMCDRHEMMAVLARAHRADLAELLVGLGDLPEAEDIRKPEIGLTMVRGRIGGDGRPFNLGEASVTRAAVRLADGTVGVSYRLGRDQVLARHLAILDALFQQPHARDRILRDVIVPLRARTETRRRRAAAQTAATRVDFFTLVRGESPT